MTQEAKKLRNSIFFVLSFTVMLWMVKALEWAVAMDFGFLGILPRTLSGTMGIVTAPLVHGDVLHLLSNTFPLLLLGISVFYFYDKIALEVFVWIYLMSGFWVWMAARDAYHIGASGLVYGLVAFLFFSGLFRRDVRSLSIAMIIVFLYGGMIQGLFPINERISWESHLLGALAGAFCAFFYRDVQVGLQEEAEEVELTPALVGGSSGLKAVDTPRGKVSAYRQMQNAVDGYDGGSFLSEDRPAVPLQTEQEPNKVKLRYQYHVRPTSIPKLVSKRTVQAFKMNASNFTGNIISYSLTSGPKKDNAPSLRTAAA